MEKVIRYNNRHQTKKELLKILLLLNCLMVALETFGQVMPIEVVEQARNRIERRSDLTLDSLEKLPYYLSCGFNPHMNLKDYSLTWTYDTTEYLDINTFKIDTVVYDEITITGPLFVKSTFDSLAAQYDLRKVTLRHFYRISSDLATALTGIDSLEIFYLKECDIYEMQEGLMPKLKNLSWFGAYECELRHLPNDICKGGSLWAISLISTTLTDIPPNIFLPTLHSLDIQYSFLCHPSDLAGVRLPKTMERLSLANNFIPRLPNDLLRIDSKRVKNLEICVDRKYLEDLPVCFLAQPNAKIFFEPDDRLYKKYSWLPTVQIYPRPSTRGRH